jgi:hypothetical protein
MNLIDQICLNLIEGSVTLYPANADGTPQLTNPIWIGAPAENLRGVERWEKKQTAPSGARYRVNHPLVPTYEITIGRLWTLLMASPLGWATSYTNYVLDITWQEEDENEWHRKTFYGVTISDRTWDAKDCENGILENQVFDAQYFVPGGGTGIAPALTTATLPLIVNYTDATGTVMLYTYAAGVFTAVTTTTGRATIVSDPFTVQFAADPPSTPVVQAAVTASLLYRNSQQYRNSDCYRNNNALKVRAIFAEPAMPSDVPRLDFYYGLTRILTITQEGIFDADYEEEALASLLPAGTFGFYGNGALAGVASNNGLAAWQIEQVLS